MKQVRRIEISMERHEVSVTRQLPASAVLHCDQCGMEVTMLHVETAAALARATPRTLYRWMEEGKVHFIESPDGTILLCAESLKKLT